MNDKTDLDPAPSWQEIDHWVFDLDNTLYPAGCHLFKQIDQKMTSFIERTVGLAAPDARALQKQYYTQYGTTLNGLMHEHSIKADDFLHYVHDIDVSVVPPNPVLAETIARLPGKRHIFTNGSVQHAENVLGQIGLDGLFDDIFDIAAAEFTPKPHRETYERFLTTCGVRPGKAAMFEDLAQNLEAAHALGMADEHLFRLGQDYANVTVIDSYDGSPVLRVLNWTP